MKGQGKYKFKFKYFLIIMFFIFIKISDFCIGLYEGIGDAGKPESIEFNIKDELSFIIIELVLSVIFYILINKKIAKPIEALTKGMECITEGKLNTRLTIKSQYEFQSMVNSFNIMAEEFEESKRIAEEHTESNNQLFACIAHDLKTPMTMIMGYSNALSSGAVVEEKKEDYLNTIFEQTKHMNELLDVLFEYAKLENKEYGMRMEKSDLCECLRACIAGYFERFEQKSIELDIDLPEQAVECCFDKLEMSRVFYNLLSNVVKHNLAGTKVFISLTIVSEDKIKIIIADNGTQIGDALKANLFRPFRMGDESRSSNGGSGLGLAIASRIVEKHFGEITLLEPWKEYVKAFEITLPY